MYECRKSVEGDAPLSLILVTKPRAFRFIGGGRKRTENENIRLPVVVRGSKTSVLKLSSRETVFLPYAASIRSMSYFNPSFLVYKSCAEFRDAGAQTSGVYKIQDQSSVFHVYCDQSYKKGGK